MDDNDTSYSTLVAHHGHVTPKLFIETGSGFEHDRDIVDVMKEEAVKNSTFRFLIGCFPTAIMAYASSCGTAPFHMPYFSCFFIYTFTSAFQQQHDYYSRNVHVAIFCVFVKEVPLSLKKKQ